MASEINVNTILPQTGNTITLGSGSTTVNYGGNITVSGTMTATSFSGDGSGLTGVGTTWESKSSAFTAEVAKAYFCDTSSSAFTATLPSSASAGDEVRFLDVSGTFDTNNLTVGRNNHNIQGAGSDLVVSTERAGFALVYYNATQGWLLKDK
jgi:hypothetical protein|tara:strand:+ start:56 stop:511 length:456 start_codon:yes stop_codon:yes gene_type:complete